MDGVKSTNLNDDQGSISREISSIRLPRSASFWPCYTDRSARGDHYYNGNNDSMIDEQISMRKISILHMAARRAKPGASPKNNDDSIICENFAQDSPDGVDIQDRQIPMTFDFLDAASLVFSMLSFIVDMVTDSAVAVFHYYNNDYWYSALTTAFIIVPNSITSCISFRWYLCDSQIDGSTPVGKFQWFLRILFHVCLVGPVLRYYESLQYGIKYKESKDPNEKKKVYMKMIYEDADATMLRLFESFMESAPQLMLQMYIIAKNYPFDDYEYWTAVVQSISISSSLLSISWSLVSYSKSLRNSLPNKIPMNYWSIGAMFLWEFFSITARMLALALFTSAFVKYVGFVCLCHWAIMTGWILTMKTTFCNTRFEELCFNAVLGVIFIFCYFNPVDSSTRYRYLAFYAFMFVENTALMSIWYQNTNYEHIIKQGAVTLHYGCFFMGILLMLNYYRWFHPTGGIRLAGTKPNDTP